MATVTILNGPAVSGSSATSIGSVTVDSVTGEVEIKNDSGNPLSTDVSVFNPATTTSLSVSTVSARAALPAGSAVRLSNSGVYTISFQLGDSTVTASSSSMDLIPGSVEVFKVPVGATHIAAIVSAGTATLKITGGAGV